MRKNGKGDRKMLHKFKNLWSKRKKTEEKEEVSNFYKTNREIMKQIHEMKIKTKSHFENIGEVPPKTLSMEKEYFENLIFYISKIELLGKNTDVTCELLEEKLTFNPTKERHNFKCEIRKDVYLIISFTVYIGGMQFISISNADIFFKENEKMKRQYLIKPHANLSTLSWKEETPNSLKCMVKQYFEKKKEEYEEVSKAEKVQLFMAKKQQHFHNQQVLKEKRQERLQFLQEKKEHAKKWENQFSPAPYMFEENVQPVTLVSKKNEVRNLILPLFSTIHSYLRYTNNAETYRVEPINANTFKMHLDQNVFVILRYYKFQKYLNVFSENLQNDNEDKIFKLTSLEVVGTMKQEEVPLLSYSQHYTYMYSEKAKTLWEHALQNMQNRVNKIEKEQEEKEQQKLIARKKEIEDFIH